MAIGLVVFHSSPPYQSLLFISFILDFLQFLCLVFLLFFLLRKDKNKKKFFFLKSKCNLVILLHLLYSIRGQKSAPASTPSPSQRPVGKNVAELRDKIQQQLYKRDAKKPAGGIDVSGGEADTASSGKGNHQSTIWIDYPMKCSIS